MRDFQSRIRQFRTRTNSLQNYIKYLQDLADIKLELISENRASMDDYHRIKYIIDDLIKITKIS